MKKHQPSDLTTYILRQRKWLLANLQEIGVMCNDVYIQCEATQDGCKWRVIVFDDLKCRYCAIAPTYKGALRELYCMVEADKQNEINKAEVNHG